MKQSVRKGKGRFLGTFILLLMVFSAVQAFPIFAARATTVGSYSQLKSAMENSAVTSIQLSRDIKLEAKKVYVNSSRASLVIDGNGHTITDAASTVNSNLFTLSSRGRLNSITVQNVEFEGKNDNGFIYVPDSSAYKGLKITYDNVNYVGPQAIDAKYSDIVLKDSTFKLIPGYCSDASDLAEGHRITLTGDIEITKDAPKGDSEIFNLHHTDGAMTIAEGANVNVSNNCTVDRKTSRYHANYTTVKDSGFIELTSGGNNFSLVFEPSSTFNYAGNNIFQQGEMFKCVTIDEDALVDITTNGEYYSSESIFKLAGTMTVGNDSVLNIRSLGNTRSDYPAIQLRSRSEIIFNAPKEVFVYNSSNCYGSREGLAIAPVSTEAKIMVKDVNSIEYWRKNTSSVENLNRATYDWRNARLSEFDMCSTINGSMVFYLSNPGYNGSTSMTKSTAEVRYVNVMSINGGRGKEIQADATVKFNANGGTPTPASQEVRIGEKVVKPDDPTRTGYIFSGWYTSSACITGAWDFDRDVVKGDMTLYAKWDKIQSYTVSYNTDGGSAVPSETVVAGGTATKPADPTKESFVFDGWYLAEDLSGNAWNFDTDTVNGNMMLYAKWTEAAPEPTVFMYRIAYFQGELNNAYLLGGNQARVYFDPPLVAGAEIEISEDLLNARRDMLDNPDNYAAGQVYIDKNTPSDDNKVIFDADNQVVYVVYRELEKEEITFVIDHIEPMFFGDELLFVERDQSVVTAKVGDFIILSDPEYATDLILGEPAIAEVLYKPDRTYMDTFQVTADLMNVNVYYTVTDAPVGRIFAAEAFEVRVFTVDYADFEIGMSVREYLEEVFADFLANAE